jgi:imidazolonepropionase-like amidohydrolase
MTTTRDRRRRRTAIHADRLFDGTAAVADPLVLVEDGRITAVHSGTRVTAPPDTELVELPGATLLPGLVDAHVHLAFDAGPAPVAALADRDDDAALAAMAAAAAAQLRAGVTTVRDLGDRGYLALRLRGAAGVPLPTIVASGPPITSPGGHCHFLGGVATGVDGVRAAVRDHIERGVDVIKVMASGGELTPGTDVHAAQFSPAELRALVDEAHRHGLPVTAHAHAVEAIAQAVGAGVDGIEHRAFRTPEGVHAPDDLVAAVVARRIAVGATVGVLPVDGVAPPPGLVRDLPAILAVLARLCREGAVVVAGTDAGIAPVKPHGVLPVGLAQLAELAMGNTGALRAGTSVAAQVCGLGDRKGRVAPGYDADLLAVEGDPAADIAALHRVVAVFVGGRPVAAVTPALA